jgi:hypothetical protein
MKITNKHNLPEPVYNAVNNHDHKSGDYSASMLYKSPRQVHLAKRHYNEIEKDAVDMVWALFGTALHYVLEKGATKDSLTEEYMTADIHGKILSGSSDLLTVTEKGYKVSDYKTVSAWSIIYMSSMEDWTKQLNTYAYLFHKNGVDISELEIVAFMRDWQKSKAKIDRKYPQCQVKAINIPLWSLEEQREYIESRVQMFESMKDIPDDELPECTREELWQSEDKYAVMKKGGKRAVKLYDNRDAAIQHATELPTGFIQTRKGTVKRCEYCDGRQFCNQYKRLVEEKLI